MPEIPLYHVALTAFPASVRAFFIPPTKDNNMRHNPHVRAFLAIAGAMMAAANPAAMLHANPSFGGFKSAKRRKSKGRGLNGRNLFRKGGGRAYGANGAAPVARRLRQIERLMLTSSNGLVRHG